MPRLFRTLCVSLCAALMAVMSLYGPSRTEHRIAHAADWPPVAAFGGTIDADHDPLHVHVPPEPPNETGAAGIDDPDGGDARTGGHHHASGGDSPNAVPETAHAVKAILRANGVRRWSAGDRTHTDHDGDGPEHPPKQTRTVV